jgi:hypothetical protein
MQFIYFLRKDQFFRLRLTFCFSCKKKDTTAMSDALYTLFFLKCSESTFGLYQMVTLNLPVSSVRASWHLQHERQSQMGCLEGCRRFVETLFRMQSLSLTNLQSTLTHMLLLSEQGNPRMKPWPITSPR